MTALLRWMPAIVMGLGATLVYGLVVPQRDMPLGVSLASVVPASFEDYVGTDQEISEAEASVAAFNEAVMRVYSPADSASNDWVSLYVGYYESQTQGRTIHSPKNCLPGGGWEPLASQVAQVETADGSTYDVNRYILQRDDERALVLYWYQGRGRVESNEYRVKFDLLRDAALKGRTDEALARIVVPITGSEEVAFKKAVDLAELVIPVLNTALPD